jgi:hypothetical protein
VVQPVHVVTKGLLSNSAITIATQGFIWQAVSTLGVIIFDNGEVFVPGISMGEVFVVGLRSGYVFIPGFSIGEIV